MALVVRTPRSANSGAVSARRTPRSCIFSSLFRRSKSNSSPTYSWRLAAPAMSDAIASSMSSVSGRPCERRWRSCSSLSRSVSQYFIVPSVIVSSPIVSSRGPGAGHCRAFTIRPRRKTSLSRSLSGACASASLISLGDGISFSLSMRLFPFVTSRTRFSFRSHNARQFRHDQLSLGASLLDGERLHQLRTAAVGVEQVQLPAAVAPKLRRPDVSRVAHTLARCLQRFLNVGHEQRYVVQGT